MIGGDDVPNTTSSQLQEQQWFVTITVRMSILSSAVVNYVSVLTFPREVRSKHSFPSILLTGG